MDHLVSILLIYHHNLSLLICRFTRSICKYFYKYLISLKTYLAINGDEFFIQSKFLLIKKERFRSIIEILVYIKSTLPKKKKRRRKEKSLAVVGVWEWNMNDRSTTSLHNDDVAILSAIEVLWFVSIYLTVNFFWYI